MNKNKQKMVTMTAGMPTGRLIAKTLTRYFNCVQPWNSIQFVLLRNAQITQKEFLVSGNTGVSLISQTIVPFRLGTMTPKASTLDWNFEAKSVLNLYYKICAESIFDAIFIFDHFDIPIFD